MLYLHKYNTYLTYNLYNFNISGFFFTGNYIQNLRKQNFEMPFLSKFLNRS